MKVTILTMIVGTARYKTLCQVLKKIQIQIFSR